MSTMIIVSLQMLTQVLNRVCHPENTFNRIIVLRLPGEFLLIFCQSTINHTTETTICILMYTYYSSVSE